MKEMASHITKEIDAALMAIALFKIPSDIPRPFRAAWKRGFFDRWRSDAAMNPYADRRTGYKNGATFSTAWRRYWEGGRKGAEAAMERGRRLLKQRRKP